MRYGTRCPKGVVLALGLLLVGAGVARAQEPVVVEEERESTFEIRAGAAIPGGGLSGQFDPGFTGGVDIGFPLAPRTRFTVGGDVDFLSSGGNQSPSSTTGEVEQFFRGNLRLWHYGVGLQADLTDPETSAGALAVHLGLGATTIDPHDVRIAGAGQTAVTYSAATITRFSPSAGVSLGFRMSPDADLLLRGTAYAMLLQGGDYRYAESPPSGGTHVWWSFPLQLAFRFRAP